MPSLLTVRMGSHATPARPTTATATASATSAVANPRPNAGNAAATGAAYVAGPNSGLSMYASTIYGPGVAVDTKSNLIVNASNVAIRFVPSVSSTLDSVVLPWRWGSGYSTGTGGSFSVEVRADDGTASHKPSGTVLASVTYTPSGAEIALSDTRYKTHTFSSPASVTAGTRYHIVVRNTHATPASNYSSINMVLRALGTSYGGTSPLGTAQPAFSDDFAALYGSSYTLRDETPVINITYGDGSHDGNTYLASGCNVGSQSFGGTTYVRQRFTVSGSSRTASGIYVRPKLVSGSGSLTVDLRTTSASIESISIPASSFITQASGCLEGDGPLWLGAAFTASRTLSAGTSYELRMTAPSGTTYHLESPLREESSGGTGGLVSAAARWSDRIANPEVSTNSGSSWGVIYSGFPVDMPFYFTVS